MRIWWILFGFASWTMGFSPNSNNINTAEKDGKETDSTVDSSRSILAPPVKPISEHRTDYSMLPVLIYSSKVSSLLRSLTAQELGVNKMQESFDGLKFKVMRIDLVETVKKLTSALDTKLGSYQKSLTAVRNVVEETYVKSPFDMQIFRPYRDCCTLKQEHLGPYSPSFQSKINATVSCDIVPSSLSHFSFYPSANLTPLFVKIRSTSPSIKWQFFISTSGLQVEYPAHSFDLLNEANCRAVENQRHRSAYIATTLPYEKHVVVLIDVGNAIKSNELAAAKSVAKALIGALSHHDHVTVVSIATHDRVAASSCEDSSLPIATYEAKLLMERFVDTLEKEPGNTNHSQGFVRAFDLLKRPQMKRGHSHIFYISRGYLSSLDEAGRVLSVIASENLKVANTVRISTFAIVDYTKPPLLETKFLEDLSTQNVTKYAQSQTQALLALWNHTATKPPKGKMVTVNSSEGATLTLEQLYGCFAPDAVLRENKFLLPLKSNDFIMSEPQWDKSSRGLIISMTQAVVSPTTNILIGVLGFDFHFSDLAETVRYFSPRVTNSYAMLIDTLGNTLVHPKLMRPMFWVKEPFEVDISKQEEAIGQQSGKLREEMLNSASGVRTVTVGGVQSATNGSAQTITYAWQRAKNTQYIVIVALKNQDNSVKIPEDYRPVSRSDVSYHRLDLIPIDHMCMQLRQLSSKTVSSLFLSARCFQESFRHLSEEETRAMAQAYIAYINDVTRLIANPGLKAEVREEVIAISQIASEWKLIAEKSEFRGNILRRYIAAPGGAMLVYPGTVFDKTFDPVSRDWYQRAVRNPGKTFVTGPYFDPSGAGYVVSISQTVFEGKKTPHSDTDQVVAVMGMDVTVSFLYSLLVKNLPSCTDKHTKCFLFDDRGYLVAHSQAVSELRPDAPAEQAHMARKESYIMTDLLGNADLDLFVQKVVCNRYADGTVQRAYSFNTSYAEVVRNKKWEYCAKYQIYRVEDTNVFLGVVNQTCNRQAAFVPCSVNDRRCLNCHRAEPTECECPCECPLMFDSCPFSFDQTERLATCDKPEEPIRLPVIDTTFFSLEKAMPCFDVTCGEFNNADSCDSAIGCAWCRIDFDHVTPLSKPYCSAITECFTGVKGVSSFQDRNSRAVFNVDNNSVSTPVGPVAGGIMSIFALLVVGVYCYRHQMARLVEGNRGPFGTGAGSDSGSRLHPCDDLDDECHFDDGTGNSNKLILASFERDNLNVISPFRRPPYRPGMPPESDHGYSTMKDNEDSEQATTVDSVVLPDKRASVRLRPLAKLGFATERQSGGVEVLRGGDAPSVFSSSESDSACESMANSSIFSREAMANRMSATKADLGKSLLKSQPIAILGPNTADLIDSSNDVPPPQTKLNGCGSVEGVENPLNDLNVIVTTAQVHTC